MKQIRLGIPPILTTTAMAILAIYYMYTGEWAWAAINWFVILLDLTLLKRLRESMKK